MAEPISVVIPVGPRPHHREFLEDCLISVLFQLDDDDEVLVIENGGEPLDLPASVSVWRSPWPLGVPAGFNLGVALAANELVFMLGSDDFILEGCMDALRSAWEKRRDPLGWYYLGVIDSEGRTQNTPCHAAMVTKRLWRFTGGFPPESAVGACDTMLISMLLHARGKSWSGNFHKVADGPLYWWRVHPLNDTLSRRDRGWDSIIHGVRDMLTREWSPDWEADL